MSKQIYNWDGNNLVKRVVEGYTSTRERVSSTCRQLSLGTHECEQPLGHVDEHRCVGACTYTWECPDAPYPHEDCACDVEGRHETHSCSDCGEEWLDE